MTLFQRATAVSTFSSLLTRRLTIQATPIAAAQVAAGVPPDQAAQNAANAVVDATPPDVVRAAAPVYPQVMQWRVIYTSANNNIGIHKDYNSQDEAVARAYSLMGSGAYKANVLVLTPSGSSSQPPIESVILQLPTPDPMRLSTVTAVAVPATATPTVDPAAAAAAAYAMKSADSFYSQNQEVFASWGYMPDVWATFTLGQKNDAINKVTSASTKQETTPEPQYVASRPAETTVIPTSADNEQAAAAMAEVDAFYSQNQALFTQSGYGPDRWSTMSLGQKSEVINAATSGTLSPNYPPIDQGSKTAPATPDTVAVTYDLQIEGGNSGSFSKLEDAVTAAVAATMPGDRFEILYNGKTTGLRIRTTTGSVDVPADIDPQVRLMTRDKVGQFVVDAETKTAATGGGVPWWIIGGGAAAAAVASRFL